MLSFDDTSASKTRRSILIFCIAIITAEQYLSPSTSQFGFGGLLLNVTKKQIIDGMCVVLLYLWCVYALQLIYTTSTVKFVTSAGTSVENKISKHIRALVKKVPDWMPEIFNLFISAALPILLTLFVWCKYDGLFRSLGALRKIILN